MSYFSQIGQQNLSFNNNAYNNYMQNLMKQSEYNKRLEEQTQCVQMRVLELKKQQLHLEQLNELNKQNATQFMKNNIAHTQQQLSVQNVLYGKNTLIEQVAESPPTVQKTPKQSTKSQSKQQSLQENKIDNSTAEQNNNQQQFNDKQSQKEDNVNQQQLEFEGNAINQQPIIPLQNNFQPNPQRVQILQTLIQKQSQQIQNLMSKLSESASESSETSEISDRDNNLQNQIQELKQLNNTKQQSQQPNTINPMLLMMMQQMMNQNQQTVQRPITKFQKPKTQETKSSLSQKTNDSELDNLIKEFLNKKKQRQKTITARNEPVDDVYQQQQIEKLKEQLESQQQQFQQQQENQQKQYQQQIQNLQQQQQQQLINQQMQMQQLQQMQQQHAATQESESESEEN